MSMTDPNSATELERLFPRIVIKLSLQWGQEALAPYLGQLLFDVRGGRQGFPEAVLSDILFLNSLHATLLSHTQKPDPDSLWNDPEYSEVAGHGGAD